MNCFLKLLVPFIFEEVLRLQPTVPYIQTLLSTGSYGLSDHVPHRWTDRVGPVGGGVVQLGPLLNLNMCYGPGLHIKIDFCFPDETPVKININPPFLRINFKKISSAYINFDEF